MSLQKVTFVGKTTQPKKKIHIVKNNKQRAQRLGIMFEFPEFPTEQRRSTVCDLVLV
jgi:hypothetical protein